MTFKDRTAEFHAVSDALLQRGDLLHRGQHKPLMKQNISTTISINKLASEIGRETADTAQKLKELTELAKSKSPFGDPTEDIERLTFIVSQDISKIKRKIEQLENHVTAHRSGNKHTSDHSVTVIHVLNSSLLSTTKEFNDALQIRTQNLKSQQERRERFTGARRPTHMGPNPIYRPSFAIYDDVEDDQNGDEVTIAVPLMQTEDDLILQRANQIRDIESHISDIKTIFEKLSNLVSVQGERLLRIEDNIDDTMNHAEGAVEQLLRYLKGMSSNRWMIINVFLILLFFIVVFVLFFA